MLDDADFRPNPDRTIWIDGEINQDLEDRLRPQILEPTSRSREPIDSGGGRAAVGGRIFRSSQIDRPGRREFLQDYHRRGLESAERSRGYSLGRRLCDRGSVKQAALPRDKNSSTGGGNSRLCVAARRGFEEFHPQIRRVTPRQVRAAICVPRLHLAHHICSTPGERQRSNPHGPGLFSGGLYQRVSPSGQKVLRQAATIWNRRYDLVTHFQEEVVRVLLEELRRTRSKCQARLGQTSTTTTPHVASHRKCI